MIKTLPSTAKLASTPTAPLKYPVTLKRRTGETIEAADPKATRAMIAAMDMDAVLGGAASHYGGPAAFAELMSAVHAVMFEDAKKQGKEWYELYNFVNDAGHCENGLYALKANYGMAGLNLEALRLFRSILSPLTGHGESHLFPEGVLLSNGPLGSAFPQSQGLAVADKLAGNNRVTVTAISDGACMEGEAREALASIPGLAAQGKMAPFVLVISDNNTKLSGRIDEDSFSMKPTFDALEPLGWKVIRLEDGHNHQACLEAFEQALELARENGGQAVAIHAKTIKGIGTAKTMASASGGHGFPLKSANDLMAFLEEIYSPDSVPQAFEAWAKSLCQKEAEKKAAAGKSAGDVPSEKIQVGIAAAMVAAKQKGLPIVSVTSDLSGSTGVADFCSKFPESTVDVGVAESNMVSLAAGMSKQGFIPVVDTFAQFGTTKGALPFIMSSLSQAPMIAVFSHTGFQDAADGASHQALSYISMLAAIPHIELYSLSSSSEAEALMTLAIEDFAKQREAGKVPPTRVFFLGRENFPRTYKESIQYKLGEAALLFDSTDKFNESVTLVTSGSLVPEAMAAAQSLEGEGVGAQVVHMSPLNHPDLETVTKCLSKTGGRLVVVEDHQKKAGMGAILVHELIEGGVSIKLASLGVDGAFGQSAYLASELYKKHGLDRAAIKDAAKTLLS